MAPTTHVLHHRRPHNFDDRDVSASYTCEDLDICHASKVMTDPITLWCRLAVKMRRLSEYALIVEKTICILRIAFAS